MSTQPLKQWKETTKQSRREALRAKYRAVQDLLELGISVEYLKPCPQQFNGQGEGWVKSQTSWNKITRSIDDLYYLTIGKKQVLRAVKLKTGGFYFIVTYFKDTKPWNG